MRPIFDERDQAILNERIGLRDKIGGPRIGDFVKMPDGRTMRFSHDWGDTIQISFGGSFYLAWDGHAAFSGGLEPSIDKDNIIDTGETKKGLFWFFHHDHRQASNGVDVGAPCRIYKYTI